MKRTTPWIVALACLTTIGGSLWAASEMKLAPWAAPAPAPPTPATPTIDPVSDQPAAGGAVTVNVHSDTTWTATSSEAWAVVTAPGTGNKDGNVTVTLQPNSGVERTAVITITTADVSVSQTVTIKQLAGAKPVTNVALDKAKDTITVGGTLTLTAAITPTDATTQTVTWASSGAAVTVPAGSTGHSVIVTGAAPGDATITVTTDDQNKTATCQVHVKAAAVPVTGVSFSPDKDTVVLGGGNRTITASPAATGVTVPVSPDPTTVATAGVRLFQATLWLVAPAGRMDAVIVRFPLPRTTVSFSGVMFTPVTATGAALTCT